MFGISTAVVFLAGFMHFNNFLLKSSHLLTICIVLNVVCSLPSFWKIQNRHAPDFHAYLNQAGAFSSGQTAYYKLSGLQGPCFYPAVHLWLYLPHYLLHLSTIYAEHISKGLMITAHTLCLVLVAKLA